MVLGVSSLSAAAQDNASISMTPYPFIVTVGMICPTLDELKATLDAIADGSAQPTTNCQTLSGNTATPATATPVEIYDHGGIYGMLTKYSALGLMDIYGIMKLEPAPAATTPKPAKSDVNA